MFSIESSPAKKEREMLSYVCMYNQGYPGGLDGWRRRGGDKLD